ncbi:unnamed protein product, partial [Brassica oleracea]
MATKSEPVLFSGVTSALLLRRKLSLSRCVLRRKLSLSRQRKGKQL